ncbi:MAG TPA: GAF domain-containing protein, partial [Ignavibacteriaceae bacterium]|nr:GAF domain-containing protein [Ignavibacteriaceae bacterium]
MPNKIDLYKEKIKQLETEIKSYQTAVEELKFLNEIAVAAGSAASVDQILKLILNKTINAINAEHGAILLVSESQEILKTFIKHDDGSRINNIPRIGEHITGWVLVNKRSLIIKDLNTDQRFNATDEEKKKIRTLVCSPIWFEGKIIGILQMINKRTRQKAEAPFGENDLTLLSIISVQAGQLIKNSELQQINFQKKQEAEYTRLRAEKAELLAKKMEAEKEFNGQKIRTRIAADLHDEIASNLTSISMFGKIIQEELEKGFSGEKDSSVINQFLERISIISQESINSIRDIIWAIDPKPETIYDLLLRLKDSFITICRANNISLIFDLPSIENVQAINLSPEERKNIWFILKEGINNSIKHSSCNKLLVSLCVDETQDNYIKIVISDNGKGFNISPDNKGKGLGF